MKRILILMAVIAAIAGISIVSLRMSGTAPATPASTPAAAPRDEVIAAPGRVEPVSGEIQISAEISGRLASVPVEEGQRIRRGQLLAVLANDDYKARLASAQAEVRTREAELRRLVNGAREEERREAQHAVQAAEAVLENARSTSARYAELLATDDVPRSEAERAEREYKVALARREASRERLRLIEAPAREEDRAKAEAAVALARARAEEASALLDKTLIRSPLDGVVLRKHLKTGESVIGSTEPQPILTIGDASVLRIRVEVDEADIARVRLGQRGWVTAAAYGSRKFDGRVVRVSPLLGRKRIRTEEPKERVDTKILEVLLELDKGQTLPAGLRVDAYILTGSAVEK